MLLALRSTRLSRSLQHAPSARQRAFSWWSWVPRTDDTATRSKEDASDVTHKLGQLPPCPRMPEQRHAYSYLWVDEYSWLERLNPMHMATHLQYERRAAERWLAHVWPMQNQLLEEALTRTPAAVATEPEALGPWLYYSERTEEGETRYMRRRADESGTAEVVLSDADAAAVDCAGAPVGQIKLSPDQTRLVFTLDVGRGSEHYSGFLKDLASPEQAVSKPSQLTSAVSVEWAGDGRTLLFTTSNMQGRPDKAVLWDTSGAGQQEGKEVLHEYDQARFLELGATKDGAFLTINSNSKTSSEVHIVDAARPWSATPVCVQPRTPGLQYFAEHWEGLLLTLSNAGSPDGAYSLFATPVSNPGQRHWRALLPAIPGGMTIEDMDVFKSCCVLYGRNVQGCPEVFISPLHGSLFGAANTQHQQTHPTDQPPDCRVAGAPSCQPSAPSQPQQAPQPACPSPANAQLYAQQSSTPAHTKGLHDDLCAASAKGKAAVMQPSTTVLHNDESAPSSALLRVPLPDWVRAVEPGANMDVFARELRLTLSSPVVPEHVYAYSLPDLDCIHHECDKPKVQDESLVLRASAQQSCRQAAVAPSVLALPSSQEATVHTADSPCTKRGLRQPNDVGLRLLRGPVEGLPGPTGRAWPGYVCETLMAHAEDGVKVPLTVAHAHGHPLHASAPALMYVYGAYGECLDLSYDPALHCLLDRGWVVAWAHVRGGGELGPAWHAAGKLERRLTPVTDLEACIRFLSRQGYCRPGRLALHASSAGGLVAGALLNRQPHLLGAVVMRSPFLDLLTAMTQPGLHLTQHEWEEFGDPSNPAHLEQLAALCPNHNLRSGVHLPPVLVTCRQDDPRVPVWGAAKWAAHARACRQLSTELGAKQAHGEQSSPVLLLADAAGGHFGRDSDAAAVTALEQAFLLETLAA